jgi:hypothetical protein
MSKKLAKKVGEKSWRKKFCQDIGIKKMDIPKSKLRKLVERRVAPLSSRQLEYRSHIFW